MKKWRSPLQRSSELCRQMLAVVFAFSLLSCGFATATSNERQDIAESLQQEAYSSEQLPDSSQDFVVPLRPSQPQVASLLSLRSDPSVEFAPDAGFSVHRQGDAAARDSNFVVPSVDEVVATSEQQSPDSQAVAQQAAAVAAVKRTESLLAQTKTRYNQELRDDGDDEEDDDEAAQHSAAVAAAAANPVSNIKSTRPSHAAGVPDTITFGVFAKGFFGTNLKANKFTVDSVLALKWFDPRVAALVPAGTESLSMSGKVALSKIWMPEVIITNRDIKKYDLISTSVTVFKNGDVTKVERAGVIINQMYDLLEYPFDTQKLEIKVASGKYMLNEVVLKPGPAENSGARDGLMDKTPYELKGHRVHSFAETDGALKKSRGVLELTVKRKFDNYRENHLMPACLLLTISWAVFWFPFQNPFVTPRLALSILALLAFTNIQIKSQAALPEGSPTNWNDTMNQTISAMMFCTIVINIVSETFKHTLAVDKLGQAINHEAKVLLPCLGITVVFIAMASGGYGWMSVTAGGILIKCIIATVMTCYLVGAMNRLGAAQRAVEEAKYQAEEEKRLKEMQTMPPSFQGAPPV